MHEIKMSKFESDINEINLNLYQLIKEKGATQLDMKNILEKSEEDMIVHKELAATEYELSLIRQERKEIQESIKKNELDKIEALRKAIKIAEKL